jgi:hypothetical protein
MSTSDSLQVNAFAAFSTRLLQSPLAHRYSELFTRKAFRVPYTAPHVRPVYKLPNKNLS